MKPMKFVKATRKRRKIRLAIAALSGGGKTMSALRIAKGIIEAEGGKIAFIDTENNSSTLYDHIVDFDMVDIRPPYDLVEFNQAMELATKEDYSVLIIDSASHAWERVQQIVAESTNASKSKNSYFEWRRGNIIATHWLRNLLYFKGHIIFCMRSKMAYETEKNSDGKICPQKIGLAPMMRDGIDFEFDILLDGNNEHYFTVTKSRYPTFSDMIIEKPDEEFGKNLVTWLNSAPESDLPDMEPVPEPEPKKKFTPKPPIEKVQKDTPLTDNKKYLKNEKPQIDLSAVLAYDANTIDPEFKPTCDRIFKGWNLLRYNDFAMKASVKKHLNANSLNVVNDQEKLTAYYYYLLKKFNETKGE